MVNHPNRATRREASDEMLAALKRIADEFYDWVNAGDNAPFTPESVTIARAAIAAAEPTKETSK